MKGCRRACLAQLAVWGVIAAGYYLYSGVPAVSVGIGLLVTLALTVVGSALGAAREWRMLTRAARGGPLKDGAWTVVSGELRTFAPLRAPLSGESVALYEYSIARDQRVGKSMSLVTYFDGKALAASSIGDVPLLTVPVVEVEPAAIDQKRVIANAREHVRTATFEQRDTARQRTSALEREWTDDDGVYRIDKRHSSSGVELDDSFRYEERHLKPRDVVCAFGVYSSARNGLVPDERWGRHARITHGTASDVARRLRGRVIRYALLAALLGALAVAAHVAAS